MKIELKIKIPLGDFLFGSGSVEAIKVLAADFGNLLFTLTWIRLTVLKSCCQTQYKTLM
jgi:hypothetical protein